MMVSVLQALGWALLSSLVNLGLLWLVYVVVTGGGQRMSATGRYLLSTVFLLTGTIWSFAGMALRDFSSSPGLQMDVSLPDAGRLSSLASSMLPLLTGLYLLTLAWLVARFLVKYVSGSRWPAEMFRPDDDLLRMLDDLVTRVGLTGNIVLWLSGKIATPLTRGILRPVIILPVAVINRLTPEQVQAIVAHELVHIRRHDYLINLVSSLCEVVLFFNPFARWLRQAAAVEREQSCDDSVLRLGFRPWEYAHALYTVAAADGRVAPTFAMAAAGNPRLLLTRVRRILGVRSESANRPGARVWPMLAGLVLIVAALSALVLKSRFETVPDVGEKMVATAASFPVRSPIRAFAKPLRPGEKSFASSADPLRSLRSPLRAFANPLRPGVKPFASSADPLRSLRSPLRAFANPLRPGEKSFVVDVQAAQVSAPVIETAPEFVRFAVSAAAPEDFTLQLPTLPSPEDVRAYMDAALPFLPSSTFFYPSSDSLPRSRHLTIIHL